MTDQSPSAEARDQTQKFSTEASTVARSLTLAIFSASWILAGLLSAAPSSGGEQTSTLAALKNSPHLYCSSVLSLASLIVDLMQYLLATLLWLRWSGHAPSVGTPRPPRWVTWPVVFLFCVKILLLALAAGSLLLYVIG